MLPNDLLKELVNKRVSLLLKDNRVLEGVLTGVDDYMNMVLEETVEMGPETSRKLGTVVLRGNNVVSIAVLS